MKSNANIARGERGAALLLALGMLTVLSVLGTALVMSLQIDTETAGLRLMKVRALHTAEAGVQCALGELMRAADPAAAIGSRRYDLGMYGPVRSSPNMLVMTAPLTNLKAYAGVSVEQISPAEYPAGAEGAAVVAKIGTDEGRLFRIVSDGTVGKVAGGGVFDRSAVRTVALVLMRQDGPQFVYWNSGPAPDAAPRAQ